MYIDNIIKRDQDRRFLWKNMLALSHGNKF